MKVTVIFDGSDDGFAGLQRAVDLLKNAGGKHEIMASLVGWPPRKSPIWNKAFAKQPILDDLHRAMAEVAATEFKRLKALFETVGDVKTEYLEGDPADEIVALIERQEPDLFVGGLTRGDDADSVISGAFSILRRTSVPAFLTFGKV
jgi:hypothetical protein